MTSPTREQDRKAYVLLFALLFLPYAYFNHSDGWNQVSRLGALHAVAIKRTLVIDAYHIYTGDKAFINGHYYSEKAPGIALLALPVFSLTVLTQRLMGIDPDSAHAWAASAWIATAGSVGLLVALAGVAFFRLLRNRFAAPVALLATIGIWLGTLAFPYATALFSHAGTMALLTIALWGVLDTNGRSPRRDYIAGLCAGVAVASEYTGVIGTACIAMYLLTQDRGRALRFGLATLPALAVILTNNYLVTGSAVHLAYGSNPDFPTEGSAGNFGHGLPRLDVARALLWGEYRGLLFWNPVLVMAVPGFVVLARLDRPLAILLAAMSGLYFLQVASFHNWHGGFAVGPRYLLPALSALGLAAAFGIATFPKTGAAIASVSIALMAMAAAVDLAPPEDIQAPLHDYYVHRLRQGRFGVNLGMLAGLPSIVSLIALGAACVILGTLASRHLLNRRL